MEGEWSQDGWFLMMGPAWRGAPGDGPPPTECVVGGWPLTDSGEPGLFHANPGYVPPDPDSPTDPVDAVLRLMVAGQAEPDRLYWALRGAVFHLAVDDAGEAIVMRVPGAGEFVMIATAAVHRGRVLAQGWRDVDLGTLVAVVGEGTDVLINPGGCAAARVVNAFVRAAAVGEDDDFLDRDGDSLLVLPWGLDPAMP
ncbi:type VII secretion system-associated protein [Actinokineospora bangkokensis]|uniref:SseB protein N-terminal domain-containing protein n=1 Tax=Actinokineospora bangkokensis TaxID=1193682 RepID=A0A1Q9LJF5_9PSEU|nr:type VII secretion system-associated protein [Actinokineospora bangkokensis]OLR92187.1 hypothetical protein BJP25_22920 [Actinokineospora bangkokensis]